ncbi:MAG: HD domain-containing protein [Deltaproteobacteria bacterium]|nr:HD domain-containing protein [Deltaproteobacteria bacterium]
MEKIFISDFKEGMAVDSIFLCSHKTVMTDKNGKPYVNLKLVDRSGSIEARIWDKAPLLAKYFERQDYVRVRGHVVFFQDHLQFNILQISKVAENEVDADAFLPHTEKNIDEMYQELLALCRAEIKNPFVQKLILALLEDPEYAPKFKRSPAATLNHHAWIGGLLEHVLGLCLLAKDTLKHYSKVNPDLVYAGLIIHDFGKIEELRSERVFEYTTRGRLIGHLIISLEILIKKAASIEGFPQAILQHIEHIILSHHGKLEHGSPKEPMTLEAIMVHQLDNMDSKLQAFVDIMNRESGESDPYWSQGSIVFGKALYKQTAEDMGQDSLFVKTISVQRAKKEESPQAVKKDHGKSDHQRKSFASKNFQKAPRQASIHQDSTPQYAGEKASHQPISQERPEQKSNVKAHDKHEKIHRPSQSFKKPLGTNLGDLINLQINQKKEDQPPQKTETADIKE